MVVPILHAMMSQSSFSVSFDIAASVAGCWTEGCRQQSGTVPIQPRLVYGLEKGPLSYTHLVPALRLSARDGSSSIDQAVVSAWLPYLGGTQTVHDEASILHDLKESLALGSSL